MSAERATFAVPLRTTPGRRPASGPVLTSGANALRAALPSPDLPPTPAGLLRGTPRRAAALGPAALRLVPQGRSHAARAPFVLLVVTLLVGGLLGLLLLNTLVAQGSFAVHDLATSNSALVQREQELAKQVQARQAPAALAADAARLGMVESGPPAFLQLPSGTVIGEPSAGVATVPVAPPAAPAVATPAARPAAVKPAARPAAVKPAAKPARKASATTPARKSAPATTRTTAQGAHR